MNQALQARSDLSFRRVGNWATYPLLISILASASWHPTLSASGEKRIAPVPPDQVTSFERGDKVAVVVGVGAYPQLSGLSPLRYAAKDAEAVGAALEAQGYLVRLLRDAEATRGTVQAALESAASVVNEEGGTLLFYFSGHGFSSPNAGGNYLATYETFTKELSATGLAFSRVKSLLEASPARRKVVLLDACRNDPGRGAKSADLRTFSEFGSAEGFRILFSTKQGDYSYEDSRLGHGLFTAFLLKGLNGEASGADGLITFRDLAAYTQSAVKRYAFGRSWTQVPWDAGEASGDFLLARSAAGGGPPPSGGLTGPGSAPQGTVPGWTDLPEGLEWRDGKAVRKRDGMEMIRVPAGSFRMGSTEEEFRLAVEQAVSEGVEKKDAEGWFSDEKPSHQVHLSDYLIDKYEVTNEQYLRFVRATGHRVPENSIDAKYNVWQGSSYPSDLARHPVVNVSWEDARAYCGWAGGRLPTEAEWEKAARGSAGQVYPWGASWVEGRSNHGRYDSGKWYADKSDGHERTSPVGSYEGRGGGSPYGVQDLAGNVWEWVQDRYGPYGRESLADPTGPSAGDRRVLRGGSCFNFATYLRAANRFRLVPDLRFIINGFRCARDL